MAKTVKFGMIWQVSGTQTLEIPDCIDPQNTEKVTEFLQEHWDEFRSCGKRVYQRLRYIG